MRIQLKEWALGLLALPAVLAAQPIANRFIVELSAEPALTGAHGIRDAKVAAQRGVVSRQQASVRAVIADRGGRVLTSMDTTLNALVVEIPEREAARLRAEPGVLGVYPDVMMHARLDRVLALSNVPAAFQKIGGSSKAGAGMLIGILDTGIDSSHPGFQDNSLPAVNGFPLTNSAANKQYVTKKVIVARSYENLAGDGYGKDASDRQGHGTNAACAAGCVVHDAPIGSISGVAPKAYLASYKVLGDNGSGPTSAILKGIDDGVKDGCDVLNLSLGGDVAPDPAGDIQVKALNLAADAGVVIVAAAGNAGPDENTINSPGTAEKAITVGSSSSDRTLDDGSAVKIDPNRISGFSSRGPSLSRSLKPDMVAVGDNFYTANTLLKDDGETPYKVTQGTSFASPTVAGAAALLMAARPGLTSGQYRSLLVNSSSPIFFASGDAAPIRHQGAGRLNMTAALDLPLTIEPVSLAFGRGAGTADLTRDLTLTNVSASSIALKIAVISYDNRLAPTIVGTAPATLAAKATAKLTLQLKGTGLSGEYQGVIGIGNDKNDAIAVVPYHYTVPGGTPASITLLEAVRQGAAGEEVMFFARVVDAAGNDLASSSLTAVAGSGGGAVKTVEVNPDVRGVYAITLKLGNAGDNVFTLRSGSVTREITIVAQ